MIRVLTTVFLAALLTACGGSDPADVPGMGTEPPPLQDGGAPAPDSAVAVPLADAGDETPPPGDRSPVPGASEADYYDVVFVPAGTTRSFDLRDGDVLEGKLIDITAPGARAFITAGASDFTVRNIGFRGPHPGDENIIRASVTERGSTGLIDNVYLGHGARPGSRGGIWVDYSPPHRGELTFRRLHVAHISNNGLYGSAPGHHGQPGLVHVEDSYFYSNNISNIRLGSAAGTSYVRNSVVYVDETVHGCNDNCSVPGAINARGVWAWSGLVVLEGCDIDTGRWGRELVTTEGASFRQVDTRLGDAADVTPPAEAPMSAEQAASGGRLSVFELVARADGPSLAYTFDVEGAVIPRTTGIEGEHVAEDDDVVTAWSDGTATVEGAVASGGLGDAYLVDGALRSVELDESAWSLRLDGREVTVAELLAGD